MNQLGPGDLTKFAAIDKIERERDTVSGSQSLSVLFLFMFFSQLPFYRIATKKGRVIESCVSYVSKRHRLPAVSTISSQSLVFFLF